MRVHVKFRSTFNLVWGTPVDGIEAFAFVKGFPATFMLTDRRALVVGEFMEKMGWFQKKAYHRVIFEAGLQYVKEFKMKIEPTKRIFTAHITFKAHGLLKEDSVIQFMNIKPDIGKAIEKFIAELQIKSPLEDSGIVLVNKNAPPIQEWLNQRLGTKKGNPSVTL
ncbi:MAG: hypothetical protein E4G98_06200 [Promethearchaeota archaeon]|nr:MAG: hypothetical protein E4G98_06200 [Candidatus Lokiarchaeota archaeon]